ncbi:glycosyltransferase family 4 protein [Acinetobacter sp. 194]|uniref:glycosyltransferase family 4 protein n=1 Tax=Acinetobacter shaoyimingii TaxID=2715164 RepID=UPI00140C6E2B|nr:glycosyltransferase family 4 protein [Acinetobacter shaoyimingii]NHB56937.1 glycosyltransferase family 4 protein [Acinetobacter shaoyimingii]
MKFLHTAMMKSESSGILNQMYGESISARDIGADYKVKIFTEDTSIASKYSEILEVYRPKKKNKILRWIEFRKAYFNWLESQQDEIDCFVLRHSLYDPLQLSFLKRVKKPVYLVHHTKEIEELRTYGLKGKILSIVETVAGNQSLQHCTGIVAVTNELIEYEKQRINDPDKKSILYSNGIFFEKKEIIDHRKPETLEMLFVASYFYDWHGLDLLIESVQKSSHQNILVHLVGKITDTDQLAIQNDPRFICHGHLSSDAIAQIGQSCVIALGSFALYRKNLKEGSTLKVREYLSLGLPVYSGHVDMFPDDFKFYKFGELRIDDIIDYANEMMSYPKAVIRDSSENYISKLILLEKFIKELEYLNESIDKNT